MEWNKASKGSLYGKLLLHIIVGSKERSVQRSGGAGLIILGLCFGLSKK
jgi:hypothetical protein